MGIFKACDVRGVYPGELNEETALAIGRAIGAELGGGDCVLGGDLRPSTPALKAAVRDGLVRSGVNVTDIGTTPTPVVYWARRARGTRGAVVVTASHNLPEYNGVKFMLGDRSAGPEDMERIERRVRAGEFVSGRGAVAEQDVRAEYLAWLRGRFAGTAAGLSVLVDAGNGCASGWAPDALRDAGCKVETLFCEPDGTFPNRSPNPSRPDAVQAAARLVPEKRVDFAVAFDGDADRAVFLDERGGYVDGDKAIILLARDVLRREPGAAVVYDQKCSRRVAQEIERAGGRPVRERSGYAFIRGRLMAEGAAFAGEASGHFFFREIGGDDGIYAALRMAELLRAGGRRFSELLATIPPYYMTPDIRIPRPAADGAAVVERLKAAFAGRPQDHTDGVRIDFENGWALCRQSVTEPVITLRFEADTPEGLEAIKARVMREIPPQ